MKRSSQIQQQNSKVLGGYSVAVIGSATYAALARDALHGASVRAEVVKVSALRAHSGCAYGVRFLSAQTANVAYVLEHAGIAVREYRVE